MRRHHEPARDSAAPTRSGVMRRAVAKVQGSRYNKHVVRAILAAGRAFPVRRNLVVFESDLGRTASDSPRAIYHEILRSHPAFETVWVSAGPGLEVDPRTRCVTRLSWRYFWYLSRAGYWVNNQSFPHYVTRGSSQVFVQTWHGTPLKRMLSDAKGRGGRDPSYRKRATKASAQWTVLTSPNAHTTAAMASAFGHHARVLEVGYPRNDIFHSAEADAIAEAMRRRLGIPSGKRIVLYAPTFRDDPPGRSRGVALTAAIDFDDFAQRLGKDAVLVLRRHALDTVAASIADRFQGVVLDASSVPDVQALLLATDVLVTDYSSLFVDFLNLRRPCVFYAPDLADYRDRARGFYLDYGEDLPGPVTATSAGCIEAIERALVEDPVPGYDLDAFAALYCPHDDGHAAERVVRAVWGAGDA